MKEKNCDEVFRLYKFFFHLLSVPTPPTLTWKVHNSLLLKEDEEDFLHWMFPSYSSIGLFMLLNKHFPVYIILFYFHPSAIDKKKEYRRWGNIDVNVLVALLYVLQHFCYIVIMHLLMSFICIMDLSGLNLNEGNFLLELMY